MNKALETNNSASGSKWRFREYDERQVKALMQSFNCNETLAKVLSARGVELENAEGFLKPNLRNLLPDPLHYLDMKIAAERLAKAVAAKEKIGIFGDYDVDGATSSSLLKRFFAMLGLEAIIHIPNRIEEGYGPNEGAIQGLWDKGCTILITVDCGTVSYEPLAAAKRIGFDTIVVDHHIGGEMLPEALAIINPNRLDETTDHKYMAAVGVSFMLAVAVNAQLREEGFYKDRKEADLLSLLDLVALGTVCDVMPLKGANRAFVSQGLKVLAGRGNIGLAALADAANLNEKPGVFHLGFLLGPRINAGGRVGEAALGTKLLTTESREEADAIAAKLNELNLERRAIEAHVEEEATQIVEAEGIGNVIMPVGYGWHQGVVGIVASRLKERYNRPCAVITVNDGIGKASGRSITGVDLGAAVASARDMGLALTGGGHAMAAGFTVEEGKIDEMKAFVNERLKDQIHNHAEKILKLDAAVSVTGVTVNFVESLNRAGPFGTGNSEPRFVLPNVKIIKADIVGDAHVRCIIGDGNKTLSTICFRAIEKPLGEFLLASKGQKINLAVRLKVSVWQGREKVDVQIDDASSI